MDQSDKLKIKTVTEWQSNNWEAPAGAGIFPLDCGTGFLIRLGLYKARAGLGGARSVGPGWPEPVCVSQSESGDAGGELHQYTACLDNKCSLLVLMWVFQWVLITSWSTAASVQVSAGGRSEVSCTYKELHRVASSPPMSPCEGGGWQMLLRYQPALRHCQLSDCDHRGGKREQTGLWQSRADWPNIIRNIEEYKCCSVRWVTHVINVSERVVMGFHGVWSTQNIFKSLIFHHQ